VLTIIALGLLHVAVAYALRGGAGRSGDDLDRYWEIAGAKGIPYVTYQVEHAPLTAGFFKTIAVLTGNREDFRSMMVWTMAGVDLLAAGALLWGFGPQTAAVYLLVTLPLLPLYYTRFDMLPAASVALAAAGHRRCRPTIAAVALVAAIGFKLWPLPLGGWFLRRWREPHGRRAAVTFASIVAAFGVSWVLVGGIGGISQVVTFRGATGWQIESLVGGIVAATRGFETLRLESDAWRIGLMPPFASVALLGSGLLIACGLAWVGSADARNLGAVWLASVTTLLVFAPIISPQYMAWIAPATAIAWTEGNRRLAWLAAASALLTAVLMRAYGWLLEGSVAAVWLIILRNAALLLCAAIAARTVWRARRGAPAPAP
jgi:hypothetical protein